MRRVRASRRLRRLPFASISQFAGCFPPCACAIAQLAPGSAAAAAAASSRIATWPSRALARATNKTPALDAEQNSRGRTCSRAVRMHPTPRRSGSHSISREAQPYDKCLDNGGVRQRRLRAEIGMAPSFSVPLFQRGSIDPCPGNAARGPAGLNGAPSPALARSWGGLCGVCHPPGFVSLSAAVAPTITVMVPPSHHRPERLFGSIRKAPEFRAGSPRC
jgi:hypothetical protein